jgi:hypothetical protein
VEIMIGDCDPKRAFHLPPSGSSAAHLRRACRKRRKKSLAL